MARLSTFELLPAELVWEIVERAPDVALKLRRLSRTLKSHVDYLLLGTSSNIDELLMVSDAESSQVSMRISINMEDRLEHLKRSLSLIVTAPSACRLSKCVSANLVEYSCCWNQNNLEVIESVLDCLRGFIGQPIHQMASLEGSDFRTFRKLLDGIKISRLKLSSFAITDEGIGPLLDFIKESKLDHIELSIDESTLSDPVQLLLELSSHCKSIHIVQGNCPGRIKDNALYFFGLHNADWGTIILDMFAGRMDKLFIDNHHYPYYLKKKCANILKERLPMIGKNVWFEATCAAKRSVLDCSHNNHRIQVIYQHAHNSVVNKALTIKHSRRQGETIEEVFWRTNRPEEIITRPSRNQLRQEILGKRTLRSFYGTYLRSLTEDSGMNWRAITGSRSGEWGNWTMERCDGEIVLKANCSPSLHHLGVRYLSALPNGSITLVATQARRELWTPIKNNNGSWSLLSARGTWLALCAGGTVRQQSNRGAESQIRMETWFT